MPTSILSLKNWTLKPNQPKGPPFTPHMLSICIVDWHEEFQAPKSTLKTRDSVTKGSTPRAKPSRRQNIHVHQAHSSTRLEAPFIGTLSKEATKAQKGHSKKRKKSTHAKDKNPSQPSASTPMVIEMHKETLVVSESTTEPIFTTATLVHSESASRHDASATSTAKVNLNKYDPKDFMPERTKKLSYDQFVAETNPRVLVDQTKSGWRWLENYFLADILEIPTKLNEFTNVLSALTSKIKELEGFRVELLTDLLALPCHLCNITSQVSKLKVLDSISGIMNKVATSLERFANAISSASQRDESSGVLLVGQAATRPAEREKNTMLDPSNRSF
nr:hypothetical protein [Tanacetum cinerariifolium]